MIRTFITLVFLSVNTYLFAGYEITENCKDAQMLMMDIKLDEAKRLLADELKRNPENHYALYLEQTCYAYAMLINGSEDDYEAFLESYEKKRDIMDGRFTQSPYYLSCKSEMEMQAGMFNIIYGSEFSGVNKMYRAYKHVYENLDKFPAFKPSLMLDGFFNVAMSNLPPFVKWVTSFFGVSSDFDYGVKLLNSLYETQKNIKGANAQTALFVIFAAKINKTPEMVYPFTQNLDSNIANLFIFQYFKANIEYRTGRNDQALNSLKQIDISSHPEAKILYHYLKGKALLRKLDDGAGYHIRQYLKLLKKQEYFKEMTYNLALFELLNGNRNQYDKLCEVVQEEGAEINERDREALYDATLDYSPDVTLAKARLLLDGGYLNRFKEVLDGYDANNRKLPYQLEYYLLSGRYEMIKGNIPLAVDYFKTVIKKGKETDYYFASDAALKLGTIYENDTDLEMAKRYYKLAADLYESDFYEYIDDKAAKGLLRIKQKQP
jgi:hypothetical protein